MGRKCSHCGNIGHNSRTCTNTSNKNINGHLVNGGHGPGIRLFGVKLDLMISSSSSPSINSMKKSFSMDCLPLSAASSNSSSSSSLSSSTIHIDENYDKSSFHGYLSDGLIARVQERKKGVPWTEEEHRTFLVGLEKLGKGDWRGISRSYVTSRTPTQVASHAQKYFLRQACLNKKKRRSSLFDMVGSSKTAGTQNDLKASSVGEDDDDKNYCKDSRTMTLLDQNCSEEDIIEPVNDREIIHDYRKSELIITTDDQSHDHDRGVHVNWLYGLIDSQLKSSFSAKPITTSPNVVPDGLELTLAAPRNMEQIQPPSNSLLVGPVISVT